VLGVIGLAIAYLTRSSAIANAVGAGYVLVVGPLISRLFDTTPGWLLSGTLTAVAQGGSATVSPGTALGWADPRPENCQPLTVVLHFEKRIGPVFPPASDQHHPASSRAMATFAMEARLDRESKRCQRVCRRWLP
jgi:hypothetical protein